jgi:hypothetical protein
MFILQRAVYTRRLRLPPQSSKRRCELHGGRKLFAGNSVTLALRSKSPSCSLDVQLRRERCATKLYV